MNDSESYVAQGDNALITGRLPSFNVNPTQCPPSSRPPHSFHE